MAGDWPPSAQPVTRVIGGDGTGAATFTVPAGVVVKIESVFAELDTSGGAAAPLLTVVDDSGQVIARKRQTEAADDPALSSATWALRLADEPSSGGVLPVGYGMGAHVRRDAVMGSQVIAPNLQPLIVFNTSVWASPGMVNLGANPSIITLPVDGIWYVCGRLEWTGNAGDVDARSVLIDSVPSGSLRLWDTRIYKFDAFNFHQTAEGLLGLAAGSVIRLRPLQRSAGNRNCFATLECQWFGPLI